MATVTVTLATSLEQPRALPNGAVTSVEFDSGNVTYGGSTDVMRIAKIPNRAFIINVDGYAQCGATSVQGVLAVCEVLASGTLSVRANLCSVSVVTAGGALKTGTWLPYKVSLSDDAAVQHAMLAIKASGGTQSTSFDVRGYMLLSVTD